MTDFRTVKKGMYSVPFDIRALMDVLGREVHTDDGEIVSTQSISDQFIENLIYNADGMIDGYLLSIYGQAVLSGQSVYYKGPVTISDTPSTVTLMGVVVKSTAITEQWIVKFTGEDAFTLTGSFSGAQGSGTIAADFASTNTDIEIKSADWVLGDDSVVEQGTIIVFGTYTSHNTVRTLSAQLAAASVISSLYSNSESEEAAWARSLRKQAMDMLKVLVDPKNDASLTTISYTENSMESVSWTIDRFGRDLTDYGEFTDDASAFDY